MYYDWTFKATNLNSDTAEIIYGDIFYVSNYLEVSTIDFLKLWSQRKILNYTYTVEAFDENGYLVEPTKKYKIGKSDVQYDYLYRHLRLYGNTVCDFDPEPHLKRLKKDGYPVEYEFKPGGWVTSQDEMKQHYNDHYILWVVN